MFALCAPALHKMQSSESEMRAPGEQSESSQPSSMRPGMMPGMGFNPMMGMNPMMGQMPRPQSGMNPMMGQMAMGMNPMMAMGMNGMARMAAMNPMMAAMNPMMGMNPMMAMMGAANPMMMAQQQSLAAASAVTETVAVEAAKTVDPRVKRLCIGFNIDSKAMEMLQEAMLSRDDYDEDIQALQLLMERDVGKGKKPSEALRTQVRALKANRFPGKDLLNPDIWNFATKYDLDDRILNKLISTLKLREHTMKEDIKALDERLVNTTQPTGLGLLVRLLEGLEETGRLPSPPRRLGGSGRFNPTGTFLHPVLPKGKGKGRDKDRDEDRRESRKSRSRSWRPRKRSWPRSRSRSRGMRR